MLSFNIQHGCIHLKPQLDTLKAKLMLKPWSAPQALIHLIQVNVVQIGGGQVETARETLHLVLRGRRAWWGELKITMTWKTVDLINNSGNHQEANTLHKIFSDAGQQWCTKLPADYCLVPYSSFILHEHGDLTTTGLLSPEEDLLCPKCCHVHVE